MVLDRCVDYGVVYACKYGYGYTLHTTVVIINRSDTRHMPLHDRLQALFNGGIISGCDLKHAMILYQIQLKL